MPRTRRKFGNRKVTRGGITFDSKAEARHALELTLRTKAGEIKGWKEKPVYPLIINGIKIGRFTPDFLVYENDGTETIEEVKGGKATQTGEFSLRLRVFKACYPDKKVVIIER